MKKLSLLLVTTLLALSACEEGPVGNAHVPEPAKQVELKRYLGTWYEMGRYKNRFEKNCTGVTAEYSVRDDGEITVLNSCHKGAPDGPLETAEGKAYVVENSNNAKLKVSFFGPFYGDYWVLDHAQDYSWSIVGEPSGRYLWILTRKPKSEVLKKKLWARAKALGYDTSLIHATVH